MLLGWSANHYILFLFNFLFNFCRNSAAPIMPTEHFMQYKHPCLALLQPLLSAHRWATDSEVVHFINDKDILASDIWCRWPKRTFGESLKKKLSCRQGLFLWKNNMFFYTKSTVNILWSVGHISILHALGDELLALITCSSIDLAKWHRKGQIET